MPGDETSYESSAADERFRAFAENTGDVLWIAEVEIGRLTYLSPAFQTVWGLEVSDAMADLDRWKSCIHPEDREKTLAAMPRAVAGERVTSSYRIIRPSDGGLRWIRDAGFPIRDFDGVIRSVGGIAQDVTDSVRACDHSRMLADELQHRVRNNIAVVRRLAERTAQRHQDLEDFMAHFEGRLSALARFQSFSTHEVNARVDLEDLIREELLSQIADEARVTLSGPRVRLDQKSAQVLALALHELATNATKFGALGDGGTTTVNWSVDRAVTPQRLELVWTESLAVIKPAGQSGFGTEQIERAIAFDLGGVGELQMHSHGAEARITIPLTGPALRAATAPPSC